MIYDSGNRPPQWYSVFLHTLKGKCDDNYEALTSKTKAVVTAYKPHLYRAL